MSTTIRFAAMLLATALGACAVTTGTKSGDGAKGGAASAKDDSLYRALGGTPGIERVVDAALAEIHNDLRINLFFENTDLADLRRLLIEQICSATGGPCEYTGRSMEEAHSGLALTDADFDAFVEDLVRAMKSAAVPAEAQSRLLALLGPMRGQVVGQ